VRLLLLLCLIPQLLLAQPNSTPTYYELIEMYRSLEAAHPEVCKLNEEGLTDSGLPLHAFVINGSGELKPEVQGKNLVYFILNGIHPGEAAGINASWAFAKAKTALPPKGITYVIIPIYNIGGALNRNSTTRANQNGPESYGFRGNARNLDLNRDCIKNDSQNARSLARIFQAWKPHIFVDTHTSNGADYQPTMTLIGPMPERLNPMQRQFVKSELTPELYSKMASRKQEMVPYVNGLKEIPDYGIAAFSDAPRYTTGYAALFNTLGFVTEAHMLKPFDDRVKATLDFLEVLDEIVTSKKQLIRSIKVVADEATTSMEKYAYNWGLTAETEALEFPGYEADTTVLSLVTGKPTLRYRRDKPFRKQIPYYNQHEAKSEVKLPAAYILPKAWVEVLERLDANSIAYQRLKRDTALTVTAHVVENFTSTKRPYEGHFRHTSVETREVTQTIQFYAGDLWIPTNQLGNAYLAHVFTPDAEDSFFRWNFFDSCLAQKEYYSEYVFDATAAELLDENMALRKSFELKKREDPSFTDDPRAQLDFIYNLSPYHEVSAYRLPVYRLER